MPAAVIRETAHAYARADRAMICWTLGITEHHNAVDNVLSLINLGLLCGHVGRYGSGLNPLRGQNNVQGGGDMGAIPNKLPGFQDIERDDEARARFEAAWDATIQPALRLAPDADVPRHGARRAAHALRDRREPGPVGGRHQRTRASCSRGLDFLVVQDIVFTRTAEFADVVLPVVGLVVRDRGHGDEQRAARPARAQGARSAGRGARRHLDPRPSWPRRLGRDWGDPTPEQVWDELRSLSPMHARHELRPARGARRHPVALPRRGPPRARRSCTGGSGQEPIEGPPAPFTVVEARPPFEALDADYPLRLTTGRRLESYNTGAQSNLYRSPLHRGESLDLSPEDADASSSTDGRDRPRLVAPRLGRGSCADRSVAAAGLAFMTFHFPDQVDTNQLTIDATDPKSGTAEFKAAAIRVEKLDPPAERAGRAARARAGRQLWTSASSPTPSRPPPSARRVDPVLGLPGSSWEGGRGSRTRPATRPSGGTTRASGATCCCRRCGPCRSDRLDQPRRAERVCARLTMPPADAYGVATFYALLALEPRPARVMHVCDDIACRCHGSVELIAQLEERSVPRASSPTTARPPGTAARASASATALPRRSLTIAGEEPIERVLAPTSRPRRARAARGRRARPRRRPRCPQEPGDACGCCAARGRSSRPASTRTGPSGGYAALRRAIELGPEGVLRELRTRS